MDTFLNVDDTRHTKTTVQIRHGRSLVSGFAEWTCFLGKARGPSSSQAHAHSGSGHPETSNKLLHFVLQVSWGSCPARSFHPSKAKTKVKSTSPTPGPAQPPNTFPDSSRNWSPTHRQTSLTPCTPNGTGFDGSVPWAQRALSQESPSPHFPCEAFHSSHSTLLLAPLSKVRAPLLGSRDSTTYPARKASQLPKDTCTLTSRKLMRVNR